MKNECDIVKDLLFSYNDGVLSSASKELVENHLKTCENCKNALEEIKSENEKRKEVKEIDFFKYVKRNLTKKNIIILIGLIVLLLIIMFNILVFKNYKEIASTDEIYLKDDITEEQVENIKSKIIGVSENLELEYVSKDKALERLKNNFNDNQNLLDGYNSQNNPLQASIEIKTNTNIQTIIDNVQNMPGIANIKTHINCNPYELFISKLMQ